MNKLKYKAIIFSIIFILLANLENIKSYINSFLNKDSPQLVLVLGGDLDREYTGANLAKILNLPLIISGGSNPEYANWAIRKIGLNQDQFQLDYRAKDTLTNFTSLVDDFAVKEVSHLYLITSSDHLPRAKKVGNIIAGSRGIKLTTISVPCEPNCKEESLNKQFRDVIRSITWVLTKRDLKNLNSFNERQK
tara:strand:- start:351 stop:926 length:576 start_codon:yes stop_codon:yes gene_type:complete